MIQQNSYVCQWGPCMPLVDSWEPKGKAETTESCPEVSLAHQAGTKI